MLKIGSILKIVGVVFVVLIFILFMTGFYFYNFYVFKEIRICAGERMNSGILCGARQDCVDLVVTQGVNFSKLDGMPDFVKNEFDVVFDEVIYCEGTCFVRVVRGVDYETGELMNLESCDEGEIEFVMKIRGKEGVEILRWMRSIKE